MGCYDYEQLKKRLYSGIICDVLDQLGFRNQAIGNKMKPITEDTVMLGKAFTVIGAEVFSMPATPFKKQIETIEYIGEGEIYTITTLGVYSAAFWGELLSTAVAIKKGAGALIDGMARDVKAIKEMGFPLFTKGYMPTTSKGRLEVIDYQVPIVIDGVRICPGDIIFGDIDGIAVIPKDLEDEVFKRSLELVANENNVRGKLLEGQPLKTIYSEMGVF